MHNLRQVKKSENRRFALAAGLLFTGIFAGFATSSLATDPIPDADVSSLTQTVNLSFAGEFSGQAFSCEHKYENTGVADTTVMLADFKLFVSNVKLINEAGVSVPVSLDNDGLWQQDNVALLDFENGTGSCSNGTSQTNTKVMGTVPQGQYRGVSFDIGVPFELNHADPTLAAPPMNLTSMFWNWRGGYRFMRVDLVDANPEPVVMQKSADGKNMPKANKHPGSMAKPAHTGRGWALHIGSTGCNAASSTSIPDSCASPNRINVSFDAFDLRSDVLVVDPAKLLLDVDVSKNTPDTAPGCMSSPKDPECGSVFGKLGFDDAQAAQQLVVIR
ncbi:MAG: MbnP family copper-binding protein [Granulosicoccus sp.]